MFRNRLQEDHTVEVNKVALNRDDNKQVIQYDGVSMLTHGHKDIVVKDSVLSVSQWLIRRAEDSQATKIDRLKLISHKEFNKFINGRGFRGRNDYALKDLKAKFGLNLCS